MRHILPSPHNLIQYIITSGVPLRCVNDEQYRFAHPPHNIAAAVCSRNCERLLMRCDVFGYAGFNRKYDEDDAIAKRSCEECFMRKFLDLTLHSTNNDII